MPGHDVDGLDRDSNSSELSCFLTTSRALQEAIWIGQVCAWQGHNYHPLSRELDFATNKPHCSHNVLISALMGGYAMGPNTLSGSMAKLPTYQHRYTVQNETVILVYIRQ